MHLHLLIVAINSTDMQTVEKNYYGIKILKIIMITSTCLGCVLHINLDPVNTTELLYLLDQNEIIKKWRRRNHSFSQGCEASTAQKTNWLGLLHFCATESRKKWLKALSLVFMRRCRELFLFSHGNVASLPKRNTATGGGETAGRAHRHKLVADITFIVRFEFRFF